MPGVFMAAALLATQAVAAADKISVTVYADNSYRPYSYQQLGKARGVYADIMATAFSRMEDFDVTIEPVPWKRGLKYLEEGTGFALYPPYYRPKERPYIAPYSLPILSESIVAACRQSVVEKLTDFSWPRGFYGLTFAVNSGFSVVRKPFWDAVKAKKITVWHNGDSVRNIKQLLKGRLDCYLNGRLVYDIEVKRMRQDFPDLFLNSEPIVEALTIRAEWGYLGFTNHPDHPFTFKDKFVKDFNQQLSLMQQNGEVNRIINDFIAKVKSSKPLVPEG